MAIIEYNIRGLKYHLPWFMYDISNKQLITSPVIPGDIMDSKDINLVETGVPGLNYQPIQYGGGGNRKLSFTLPLIKRNNTVGNVMLLKQFDLLRNQAAGLLGMFSTQFNPTPKVLFNWGTGSIPLIYWVKKCDVSHKAGWVNAIGNPQYSEITFELWLDESNPLYIGEEVFRKISSVTGQVESGYNMAAVNRGERLY